MRGALFSVLSIIIMFFMLTSCSHQKAVQAIPTPSTTEAETLPAYSLQPGDELDIKFFYNPELNETVIVRPDGKISLQLLDDIEVAGLQPSELDELLTMRYSKELRRPVVTVIVKSFTSQRIFVGGEVVTPGLIQLESGMDPVQAVFQAGGVKETGQLEHTIIIRRGENNKPVPIRLDLEAALVGSGPGAGFQLHPHDIVYVPRSSIAEASLWVNQHIQQLLLFNGWSFGFSYDIRDNVDVSF